MKKTLRGKRYLRSRASVQIGRQKRFVRKWDRGVKALEAAVRELAESIASGSFLAAIKQAVENINELAPLMVAAIKEATARINKSYD